MQRTGWITACLRCPAISRPPLMLGSWAAEYGNDMTIFISGKDKNARRRLLLPLPDAPNRPAAGGSSPGGWPKPPCPRWFVLWRLAKAALPVVVRPLAAGQTALPSVARLLAAGQTA